MITADKSRIYGPVTGIDTHGDIEQLNVPSPKLFLSKEEIYHYENLEVYLSGVEGLDYGLLYIEVIKEGKVYPSLGLEQRTPFFMKNNMLKAVYLPDWNQVEGDYEIAVYYGEHRLDTNAPLTFSLLRKPIPESESGLSIVDLEMNRSITGRKYINPDGTRSDYKAILEWARFMDADMLWILAGETTTFHGKMKDSSPWDEGPLENLRLLKASAAQYDIDIGAYIMSFYVPGPDGIPERYKPGIGYNGENDTLYRARHISLACEMRIQDMIELARKFQEDSQIHYIGFDFIRTGRVDGYELVDFVVEETGIETPGYWEELDRSERIKWFARKIEIERNSLIIEKWRWWRAHRVAEIVKHVIDEAGITKPVWVYTLGWNHGKEHGQDPVMFFDAGVSYDAVMLYEASQSQFARLLKQWNSYIDADQGNILVGSCVDYKLLDSDKLTPPEEFFRRNTEAYKHISRGGFAKGIFFHDIARAFWGRKGRYRFMDYAAAHMSSVYGLKREYGTLDFVLEIKYIEQGEGWLEGVLQCKNNSTRAIEDIYIELISPEKPATITFYHERFGKYDVQAKGAVARIASLGNLGTFQTKSIPFCIENIEHGHSTLLFRVSAHGGNDYFVRETFSLNTYGATSIKVSRD
jgi:hypothetical protein